MSGWIDCQLDIRAKIARGDRKFPIGTRVLLRSGDYGRVVSAAQQVAREPIYFFNGGSTFSYEDCGRVFVAFRKEGATYDGNNYPENLEIVC